MKFGKLKEYRHAIFWMLLIFMAASYLFPGCSVKLKDDDAYEATGNYIFDYVSGSSYCLFLEIEDSSFPMECGIAEDIVKFCGVIVGTEDMTLPDSDDGEFFFRDTEWDRSVEGASNDIVGTWEMILDHEDDVTLEFEFKTNHSFTLKAWNLSCDDFQDEDYDGDNNQGFTNVDGIWDLIFTDTDKLETAISYTLSVNSEKKSFMLIKEGGDPTDEWYFWEGTVAINTYSHHKMTEFDKYTEEGQTEAVLQPGKYSTWLTFELTSEDEMESGSLIEEWTFDDTTKDTVTKKYTIKGNKRERDD